MDWSDPLRRLCPKVMLIGGDGGFSGVPRHIGQVLDAGRELARFVVISDRDRGGYEGVARGRVRHVQLPGLARGSGLLRHLLAARALARLIRREEPELVWAHARLAVILLRLLLLGGYLPGRRLAVSYHGLPFGPGHRSLPARLAIAFERLSLSRGPRQDLIFLSEQALRAHERAVGAGIVTRHRRSVLPNCSDLSVAPVPAEDPSRRRILLVARAGRQKNLERALRLFAHLPAAYTLALAGDGTGASRLRRRARRLLGPAQVRRVDFLGPLGDPAAEYARSDAFLLTSRYEGMPIAALEAFGAGLPLMLPDLPGTREVLARHPLSAMLTPGPEGDAAEDALRLVALTEACCRNRSLCQQRIRDAWQPAFSVSVWAPQLRRTLAGMLPDPLSRTAEEGSGIAAPFAVDAAPSAEVLPFPRSTGHAGSSSHPGAGVGGVTPRFAPHPCAGTAPSCEAVPFPPKDMGPSFRETGPASGGE